MFDERVLDALTELAGAQEDEDGCLLHQQAAETLALTWIYRERFDPSDRARFHRLTRQAQYEVRGYFEVNGRATWLD